jgi:hypothetical protein
MSPKAQYIRWADEAARAHGIDPGVLKSLISHESGWKRNARSPAGALGIAQFMPETAKGLGINPLNPKQAIFGAAKYLAGKIHHYGDVRLALASYNAGDGAVKKYGGIPPYAETQNYVKNIMRDAAHYGSTGAPQTSPGVEITAPNAPDLAGVALANLGQISSQGGHVDPMFGLQNLVSAIAEAGSTTTKVPGTQAAPSGDWGKYVRLAAGADRKDAHTAAGVKQFVGELGASLGRPLTITTGTNHNEFVVGTQRESAHWTGHAADISMSGKALTRAGRRALILAGMSPKQAAKIKGGLFNIGGYQIIFNTNEGGNHFNHLHVGLRR